MNSLFIHLSLHSLIHSNFDIYRVPGTVLDTGNTVVNKPRSLLSSPFYSIGLDINYFCNYRVMCLEQY